MDMTVEITTRTSIGDVPEYADIKIITTKEFNRITSMLERNDDDFWKVKKYMYLYIFKYLNDDELVEH